MSIKAMNWAWSQPLDDATDRLLLLKLGDESNDEGRCFIGYTRLAKAGLCVKRTAMRRVAKFVELGLLVKTERHRQNGATSSNEYHLQLDFSLSEPVPQTTTSSGGGDSQSPGGGDSQSLGASDTQESRGGCHLGVTGGVSTGVTGGVTPRSHGRFTDPCIYPTTDPTDRPDPLREGGVPKSCPEDTGSGMVDPPPSPGHDPGYRSEPEPTEDTASGKVGQQVAPPGPTRAFAMREDPPGLKRLKAIYQVPAFSDRKLRALWFDGGHESDAAVICELAATQVAECENFRQLRRRPPISLYVEDAKWNLPIVAAEQPAAAVDLDWRSEFRQQEGAGDA